MGDREQHRGCRADGSGLTATFDLFTVGPDFELGEPVGTAVLDAEFTPFGDRVTFSFSDSSSDTQFVASSVQQSLSVTASVDLPAGAGSFDLAECAATTSTTTVFETHPDTYLDLNEFVTLRCTWPVVGGFVYLDAAGDRNEQSASLVVDVETGSFFGFSDADFSRSRFSATFELESFGSEVGSATASASLSGLGRHLEETIRDGDFQQTTLTQALKADGTLSITTPPGSYQLTLNTENCSASHQRTIFRVSSPSSP